MWHIKNRHLYFYFFLHEKYSSAEILRQPKDLKYPAWSELLIGGKWYKKCLMLRKPTSDNLSDRGQHFLYTLHLHQI